MTDISKTVQAAVAEWKVGCVLEEILTRHFQPLADELESLKAQLRIRLDESWTCMKGHRWISAIQEPRPAIYWQPVQPCPYCELERLRAALAAQQEKPLTAIDLLAEISRLKSIIREMLPYLPETRDSMSVEEVDLIARATAASQEQS